MGFDISYHPIHPDEIKEWYFDRLDEIKKENLEGLKRTGERHKLEDFYMDKYIETMKAAAQTGPRDIFEKTHVYYIAVVQGFFLPYFYTRGTAFSFLLKQSPQMQAYVTDWNHLKPPHIPSPVSGRLEENYSGGVYLAPEQVKRLSQEYTLDTAIRQILSDFFEQNLPVFLKALKYAEEHGQGLLEASEVVEPDPLDLSKTGCYSNLMNCDRDGAFIYQETAMAQIREFAEQQNTTAENVVNNAEYRKTVRHENTAEAGAKKSLWKKLFRK